MWLVLSYGPKSLYFIIILHTFHYTSGQGYLDILNHTVLKWQSKPSLFAHIKSSQHLWLALFLHLPMPTSDLLTLNYSCSEGGTSLLSVLEAPTSPGAIPTWNAVPGSVNWPPPLWATFRLPSKDSVFTAPPHCSVPKPVQFLRAILFLYNTTPPKPSHLLLWRPSAYALPVQLVPSQFCTPDCSS